MRVLWIDDEPWYLEAFGDWLEAHGISCEFIADPKKALEKFSEKPLYDLIVTDFRMGELTGDDVLKSIRETNSEIPVVLFSGSPGDSKMLKSFTKVVEKSYFESLQEYILKTNEGVVP